MAFPNSRNCYKHGIGRLQCFQNHFCLIELLITIGHTGAREKKAIVERRKVIVRQEHLSRCHTETCKCSEDRASFGGQEKVGVRHVPVVPTSECLH